MTKAILVTHSPPNTPSTVNGATHRYLQLLTSLVELRIDVEIFTVGVGEIFDIDLEKLEHKLSSGLGGSGQKTHSSLRNLKLSMSKLGPNDLLIIDQPFVWPHIHSVSTPAKLIYSSHNYESDVSLQLSRIFGFNQEYFLKWRNVHKSELDLLQRSRLVISCSEEDRLKFLSSAHCYVINVPNDFQETEMTHSEKRLSNEWVYVSSDWIANWISLPLLVDPDALIKNNIYLSLVGKCVSALEQDYRGRDWLKACGSSIRRIGPVDSSDLDRILRESYGTLIPILLGGGSNLKLAEALKYRHRIISTSFGVRGRSELTNVKLANSRETFSQYLSKAESLLPAFEKSCVGSTMQGAFNFALNT